MSRRNSTRKCHLNGTRLKSNPSWLKLLALAPTRIRTIAIRLIGVTGIEKIEGSKVLESQARDHSTSFSSSIAGTAGGVSTGENSQSTGETGGAVGGAGLQVNSTSAPVSTTSEQVPPSRRVGVPANPSRSSRENHRNLSGDQEETLPRLHREGASSLPSLLPSSLQETAGRAPTTITPPSPNQPPEGLPPVSNLDISFMEAMGRTEFDVRSF